MSAPDDHFTACPHSCVEISRGRRVSGARRYPTVGAWVISTASVQVDTYTRYIKPTPDNHFTARPNCRMTASVIGRIAGGGSCPTICAGVVPPATVKIRHVRGVLSAPHDHFAASPYCRGTTSCGWRVGGAGSCPSIGAGIVSPASVVNGSAPDNHFAASPYRRVTGSCGWCVGGAGSCPSIGAGIVSPASVVNGSAPDDHFAASP